MTVHHAVPRQRGTPAVRVRLPHLAIAGGGIALGWFVVMSLPGAGMETHEAMMAPPDVPIRDPGWVGMWLLMVIAMMWPLTAPVLDAVSRASFRGWRIRLVATALTTVTALWLTFGLVAATLAHVASVPEGSPWWQVGWLLVAVVALRSSHRARLLWTCQRLPPLAPGGRQGLLSAVHAGSVSWRRCALLCGPVMVAMAVGHGAVLLIAASSAAWWEVAHPRRRHDPVPPLLLSTAAAWVAVVAVVADLPTHV
jgi:Predicted metal-binding integral membrane protein (DUF2182)